MERRNNYAIAAAQARRLFANYDHLSLARKLGAQMDAQYLYTQMLSCPYRIHLTTGEIAALAGQSWRAVEGFNESLTLLDLVCDSREDRCISGNWKNMSDFGHQFHQNLLESADPWASFLQDNPEKLDAACRALNAKEYPVKDKAYVIPLFEDLGVMLKLVYGDDEFPAAVHWFWDENALQYLKYETMYYAVGMIRDSLNEKMKVC